MAEAAGRAGLAALVFAAACARPEVTAVATPSSTPQEIRVGVVPGALSVRLGGGAPLMLRGSDGAGVIALPSGVEALIEPARTGLRVRFSTEDVIASSKLLVAPADSGQPLRLNGRDYRGAFLVTASPGGVMAVNILDLEHYLHGVVGAEMGQRTQSDLAGLRAQAVVARTVALKRAGQWRTRGYDLLSTVADQAYAGIGFENPLSSQAVEETRGLVLTYEGSVIDAFFHSTCGGRTAEGTEVFVGSARPYLRSVPDRTGTGEAWCAMSPRFRWRESWTGESLIRILAETLPAAGGSAALAQGIQDLRVLRHSATGRVEQLQLVGRGEALTIPGRVARLVLRTADGASLRSAQFSLQISRTGGRITLLVAEGSGAGHGVGMCQWGALGRSRAGQTYQEILSAYFPGTQVGRTY